MTAHRVTAGCVVARTLDGGESYYDRGAILPDTVSDEEKARLVEIGLVERDDDEVEVAEVLDEPADEVDTSPRRGRARR